MNDPQLYGFSRRTVLARVVRDPEYVEAVIRTFIECGCRDERTLIDRLVKLGISAKQARDAVKAMRPRWPKLWDRSRRLRPDSVLERLAVKWYTQPPTPTAFLNDRYPDAGREHALWLSMDDWLWEHRVALSAAQRIAVINMTLCRPGNGLRNATVDAIKRALSRYRST